MNAIPFEPNIDPICCYIKGKLYIKCGDNWISLKIPNGIFLDFNNENGMITLCSWDYSWSIMIEAKQISNKNDLWKDLLTDPPSVLTPSSPIVLADCDGEERLWGSRRNTYYEVRLFADDAFNLLEITFAVTKSYQENTEKVKNEIFDPILYSLALEPEQEIRRYAERLVF